jgi:predicted nucleic acid-binding protein
LLLACAAARLVDSQADRAISPVTAMELLQGARSRDEIKAIHELQMR